MDTKQTTPVSINYAPLDSAVTKADIADFKARHKPTAKTLSKVWSLVIVVAVVVFMLIIFGAIMSAQAAGGKGIPPFMMFIWVASLFGFVAVAYFSSRKRSQTLVRLERFATANGMRLRYDVSSPVFAGMIFDEGHSRELKESLVMADGTELGNYQYVTGSGKNRSTHSFGYIRIPLARALPHMVLDARSNNLFGALSNLPDTFHRDQTLSLEGDFDKHFTLYAPKQYERDALYVFTPDVMAKLIDEGSKYDMEVIGKELYVYTSGRLNLTNRTSLQSLFTIISTIAGELRDQTAYYADERVGDRSANIVAPQGAQLRRGTNWLVVGIVVTFIFFHVSGTFWPEMAIVSQLVIGTVIWGVIIYGIIRKARR